MESLPPHFDDAPAPAPKIRLFVEEDLNAGGSVTLGRAEAHYVTHVMRRGEGDAVALFNGRDGEWRARIENAGKGRCALSLEARIREQTPAGGPWLLFAPVKRAPIDQIARMATELGIARLWPVWTDHSAVRRVNLERLRANAIEAAEQCGRLDLPEIHEPAPLDEVLAGWDDGRRVLCCVPGADRPVTALDTRTQGVPDAAILIGPEGGWARSELDRFDKLPFVTKLSLGPRILRADTACLAALACWQALAGDWR